MVRKSISPTPPDDCTHTSSPLCVHLPSKCVSHVSGKGLSLMNTYLLCWATPCQRAVTPGMHRHPLDVPLHRYTRRRVGGPGMSQGACVAGPLQHAMPGHAMPGHAPKSCHYPRRGPACRREQVAGPLRHAAQRASPLAQACMPSGPSGPHTLHASTATLRHAGASMSPQRF